MLKLTRKHSQAVVLRVDGKLIGTVKWLSDGLLFEAAKQVEINRAEVDARKYPEKKAG